MKAKIISYDFLKNDDMDLDPDAAFCIAFDLADTFDGSGAFRTAGFSSNTEAASSALLFFGFVDSSTPTDFLFDPSVAPSRFIVIPIFCCNFVTISSVK